MRTLRPLFLLVGVLWALALPALAEPALDEALNHDALAAAVTPAKAKNIIFLVGDGMGLADVTAARIYINGLKGPGLNWENFERIGYQRTYSADSLITDSAPGASAWAIGQKINNGVISITPQGTKPKTILELAKALGKSTGLVATSTITHATPAAFGSHATSRNCENEIARQYIQDIKPDVILGGGTAKFLSTKEDPCGTKGDFIAAAKAGGWTYYTSLYQFPLDFNANPPKKLLGLFNAAGLTPEYQRTSATDEPHLYEMTWWALRVLERNPKGFFLMVEGSQIDWGNHANDKRYMLGEMKGFNDAVGIVNMWLTNHPDEAKETLVILLSDHETGGFAINGPTTRPTEAGVEVDAGWTTKEHTGVDTVVWSRGPGSEKLNRAMENTDIFAVMKDAIGAQ